MGLDMFFYASRPGATMKQAVERERELNELDWDEWMAVRESDEYPILGMGYLRKANQVFNWIDREVGDIEDCEPLPMSESDVRRLKGAAVEVIAMPWRAAKLLPTTAGFFFGSQEYDDGYFADLRETSSICSKILDEVDFDDQDVWFYAWW